MDSKTLSENIITVGNKRFLMRIYDTDLNIPYLEITVHELENDVWLKKASFKLDSENIWAFNMLFAASLHDYMLMWDPFCKHLINKDDYEQKGFHGQKQK